MPANRFLFSFGLGLFMTFGLIFGVAQAGNRVMELNLPTAAILYVDVDADGDASGLDWMNAYTTVQDALAVADSGDQIWVAEGVYYPDDGKEQINDAVTSTFVLTNGVALYGGFAPDIGVDTFDERDWMAHPTVLSGDIDHETMRDATDPNGVVTNTAYITGTNACHVVSSSGVTETAVVDGFTITAGWASVAYIANGGGGMHNSYSSPSLANVTFSGSFAAMDGGGMYNYRSSPFLVGVTFSGNSVQNGEGGGMHNYNFSSPVLISVTFSDNSARSGGGMYNSYYSSPTLTDVVFFANTADSVGGGMFSDYYSNPILTRVIFSANLANSGGGMHTLNSDPILMDVVFSANSVDSSGGGMFNGGSAPALTRVAFFANSAGGSGGGIYNRTGDPVLTNVIFSANSAGDSGGGMFNDNGQPRLMNVTMSGNLATSGGGMYSEQQSTPVLIDAIFWDNTAASGSQISNTVGSAALISFSDIQGSGGSDSWDVALGTDGGGNIDDDPLFERNPDPGANGWDGVDDDYGDLRPQLGSPVIDKGTNIGCPATDLDGGPRPLGAICDMGAYEIGYALAIHQSVDDVTPEPGQTITFTIVVENRDLGVTGGVISDVLPVGLNFLGPITLQAAHGGLAGDAPPVLASGLTISYTDRVTVTFPVTVSYGLVGGSQLVNTALVSANEVITPVQSSITLTVQNIAPIAVDDGGEGFTTDRDTAFTTANVLDNDHDPDGGTLAVSALDTTGTKGLVTDNGDGTFHYDPNGQFDTLDVGLQAADVFSYVVSDGYGGTDMATVMITVTVGGIQDNTRLYLPLLMR